jgi:multisubunit Na+/H+ antiporter MnhG subunit
MKKLAGWARQIAFSSLELEGRWYEIPSILAMSAGVNILTSLFGMWSIGLLIGGLCLTFGGVVCFAVARQIDVYRSAAWKRLHDAGKGTFEGYLREIITIRERQIVRAASWMLVALFLFLIGIASLVESAAAHASSTVSSAPCKSTVPEKGPKGAQKEIK